VFYRSLVGPHLFFSERNLSGHTERRERLPYVECAREPSRFRKALPAAAVKA